MNKSIRELLLDIQNNFSDIYLFIYFSFICNFEIIAILNDQSGGLKNGI